MKCLFSQALSHSHQLGQFNFSMINMHYNRYHVFLTVLLSVIEEREKKSKEKKRMTT